MNPPVAQKPRSLKPLFLRLLLLVLFCHVAFLVLDGVQKQWPMPDIVSSLGVPANVFRLTKGEMLVFRVLFVAVPVGWFVLMAFKHRSRRPPRSNSLIQRKRYRRR